MADIHWHDMLEYQQLLAQFARGMLSHSQKQFLTASERELLAWIFLSPEKCTPLSLSKQSGMKKEAVSRLLKQLVDKGCITKQKMPGDARSYSLSLTATGESSLDKDCMMILGPFYTLYREMGADFTKLFDLLGEANKILSKEEPDSK